MSKKMSTFTYNLYERSKVLAQLMKIDTLFTIILKKCGIPDVIFL